MHPLFEVGRVKATQAAREALERNRQGVGAFILRHRCGDWGDVPVRDARSNHAGLRGGRRVISLYTMDDGQRLVVITDADRSATRIALPAEV